MLWNITHMKDLKLNVTYFYSISFLKEVLKEDYFINIFEQTKNSKTKYFFIE